MWALPFPLPLGAKFPPPVGATGNSSPSPRSLERWEEEAEATEINRGARLLPTFFGIDIDAHSENERGMQTLARRNVSIPLTLAITAHDDPRRGVTLITSSDEDERILGGNAVGVDRISHRLRYIVLPSSIHPDGGIYKFARVEIKAGEITKFKPLQTPTWLEEVEQFISPFHHLSTIFGLRTQTGNIIPTAADRAEMCVGMRRVSRGGIQIFANGFNGKSLHSQMIRAVCALVDTAAEGHYGSEVAIELLRREWITRAGAARSQEFTDAITSARRKFRISKSVTGCPCVSVQSGKAASFRRL